MAGIPSGWSKLPQAESAEGVSDAKVRNILRALDERMEQLLGRRGNATDRAVSLGELTAAKILTDAGARVATKFTQASAQCTTADATDPTTTQALANALKANYNQLQADFANLVKALRSSGSVT